MKASPPLFKVAPALALAALLPACNNSRDNTNPFASASVTVPPPDGAALIFTSSVYSLTAGAGREIYSVSADGANVTRLTFCNNVSACDYAEAAPAPDRLRVGARRASVDTNGDGQVNEADGTALLFLDLKRGVEALLAPASRIVTGVDWSPATGTFLAYSGLPAGGGNQDLFTMDYNGQNDRNLTCPIDATAQCIPTVREVRPRLNSTESAAVFEKIDASGASQIAFFQSVSTQPALTTGPNDADPVFSPDSQHVAFRRLTDPSANDGRGSWDILTVAVDGTGLSVIANGPAYRGAPDWGTSGLAWAEADSSSQRLVVTGPSGTGAQTIVTQAAGATLSNPRWLKPPQ
jgi:Tol biopolymer transport system component